jgi:hypothetical protein
VINHAGEKLELLNFTQSREKSNSASTERAAPGAQAKLAPTPAKPGFAAAGGMPGAYYTGMVKNQQGSETGVLKISRSEGLALLNFSQSRDKSRKLNPSPASFPLPLTRR